MKRKIKQDFKRKKPVKYKKKAEDILNDPKAPTLTGKEDQAARDERAKTGKYFLNDFNFISTLGTGTFGRVRLVKHRDQPESEDPLALKCLKKSEIIRLK